MASKTRPLWLLMGASGLLVAGLAAYVRFSPAREVPPQMRRDTVTQKAPTHESKKVLVMTPRFQDNDLTFDHSEKAVPDGQDKIVFAVNAFLDGVPAVAKGARLKTVTVKDGLVELDFAPEFAQTYGTDDERTIVNGILTVLGQFPEIKSAKFLAEGKPIDTLGNIELTDPQPVLRPGE